MLNYYYDQFLNTNASKSSDAKRKKTETDDKIRTPYAVDRDRILYCKAFRRLKHKTQVFIAPQGDHFISRLTHTLEVSQIARTIARALKLNEELCEAIALGHDLGHTPFGHAGEQAIREVTGIKFTHARQSIRVVEYIEKSGKGLNLTRQVKDGIFLHSKGKGEIIPTGENEIPHTLEGQIVRLADIIAYTNHDTTDAIRSFLISEEDLPFAVKSNLGITHSQRIASMVTDIVYSTVANNYRQITMSKEKLDALTLFRTFLYKTVYNYPSVVKEATKAKKITEELFGYFYDHYPEVPYQTNDKITDIVDYISGMTDQFAINCYKSIFIPNAWRASEQTNRRY